jgi:hypothetical protein
MDQLQITATLKSPVIVGSSSYMTLDGILGAVLFDHLQDIGAAHDAIPIKQTTGLFHASAVIVEAIDKGRTAFIAGLYPEHSIDPDLILRNQIGNLHRRFDSSLTNVMNTYRQITAPSATWYVVGDADRIKALLNAVEFIGKRRASGFGQVKSWSIEKTETDGLMGYEGEPMRPIPIEMFEGDKTLPVTDAAWRPAYWDLKNRGACYAPALLN